MLRETFQSGESELGDLRGVGSLPPSLQKLLPGLSVDPGAWIPGSLGGSRAKTGSGRRQLSRDRLV